MSSFHVVLLALPVRRYRWVEGGCWLSFLSLRTMLVYRDDTSFILGLGSCVMRTSLWSLATTHERLIVPLGNEASGQINVQITVSNGASFLCRCSTRGQDGRIFSR